MLKHSGEVNCVTFIADDKHILSGSVDKNISEWPTSEDAGLSYNRLKDGLMKEQATHQAQAYSGFKVWPTAEKVLIIDIDFDANDHIAYANHAIVMARKSNWDQAFLDAFRSVSIQPSLVGHISKGIALCGKSRFWPQGYHLTHPCLQTEI
ncbi:hypothetical protein BDR04DRAFT_108414 [Suillus decipiens]|nr:hypothetical protein BDR04DRAFT_108414 [Suillus decipiens]